MADMGKMLGPLPTGAWLAVIAGGLGIALYTRNQSQGSGEPQEDTSGVPGVGEGPGWVAVPPPSSAPATGQTAPETNEEWARQAINYLIAMGYDPAVSDAAIRKYLGGEKLGAQEYTLIKEALRKLGSPPIPLPPPIFAPPTIPTPNIPSPHPTPSPKPPAPKPVVRYYTVVKGDSLWRIAAKYYKTGIQWPRIYNANRSGARRSDGTTGMIRNPNLIYPGWKLIIP